MILQNVTIYFSSLLFFLFQLAARFCLVESLLADAAPNAEMAGKKNEQAKKGKAKQGTQQFQWQTKVGRCSK